MLTRRPYYACLQGILLRYNLQHSREFFSNLWEKWRAHGPPPHIYKKAIAAFNKSLDRSSNDYLAHFSLACAYSLADRNEDAQAEAQKVLQKVPNFSLKHFARRLSYKNPADKHLIIDAASKAGLPE